MSDNERTQSGFGAETTAAEVLAGVDLTGKRAIVTGASSGIGVETARALASAGAEVTLAVRDVQRGSEVAAAISTQTGNRKVRVLPIDLGDLTSVTAFVAGWEGPLDILVNNAGIMNLPSRELTPQGWEKQFGTNHLGHFALTLGLRGVLAAAGSARVVVVSSSAHHFSDIDLEDVNYDHRPYEGRAAYGQSKTAGVLFVVEAAKRWAGDGITVNAIHPGGIHTGLQRHTEMTPEITALFDSITWKTPEQGAATSVFAAASPLVEGISGRYFEDVHEAPIVTEAGDSGVRDYAMDPSRAAQLWALSLTALD